MTANNLAIVVMGASGHLARTKIFPALFSLYSRDYLPANFSVYGYARSENDDRGFRRKIEPHLTCRYVPGEASCARLMRAFLERCRYVTGGYASVAGMRVLLEAIRRHSGEQTDVIAYFAVPPAVFADLARTLARAGLTSLPGPDGCFRAVIEKPFGADRASSDKLTRSLAAVIAEEQTYRIDHYLGKEVVQNLLVLRFANLVFEPIWNRRYIDSVRIVWKERHGVNGRGGYFDGIGIIRDVMQNHLLQILSLIAMETPAGLEADRVRDEKVKVLRCIPPPGMQDAVLGQYTAADADGRKQPGYTGEPTVPSDSLTPTFAAIALRIDNARWDGVPFMIRAGKALNDTCTEIRIRFKAVPGRNFKGPDFPADRNELVIRVQPEESIALHILSKEPGLQLKLRDAELDLSYGTRFPQLIPEAYESLLLDVLEGDKSLFIRDDELATAWDIFTPLLHAIDERRPVPEPYAFGSSGPDAAARPASALGVP